MHCSRAQLLGFNMLLAIMTVVMVCLTAQYALARALSTVSLTLAGGADLGALVPCLIAALSVLFVAAVWIWPRGGALFGPRLFLALVERDWPELERLLVPNAGMLLVITCAGQLLV